MKKFVLLFSGALILFSCAKQVETPVEVPAGKTYTITAELDNPATRSLTSYDETIGKFMFSWEQNEVIGVVPNGYSTILDFKSVNPTNGVFSFEQRPDDPNEYDSFVMAVSPRAALSDVTTGENTVSYSINYIGQYFQEQSNAIMVAGTPTPKSDGTQHFKFKHVGALVKVSYANVPAGTHAMVFSTPDHNITGSFTFNSATGVEAVASTATTGTEARVVFLNEPTENQESVDFYLPIPTGKYQTFNVKLVKLVGEEEVTIDGSEQTFSTTSPFTVARADVVRCPVVTVQDPDDYSGEWIMVGEAEGDYYACPAYTSGNNNIHGVDVAVNGNVVTSDNQTLKMTFTRVTTGTYEGMYTIQDANDWYLYAAGSSNNYLKATASINNNSEADYYWDIEEDPDGGFSIIASKSEKRNILRFNNTNNGPLFNCYSVTSSGVAGSNVLLYKYEDAVIETPSCATPAISCSNNVITITCGTADATIYYEIGADEATTNEPTTSSSVYDSSNKPSIAANSYVKAIAVADGYNNSAVAGASVTYTENNPETWTLVTSTSELVAGDLIVIACNTQGAVAGSLNSNKGYLTSVTSGVSFSSDNNKGTIVNLPSEALQFTLGGSTDEWTFTCSAGQLYTNSTDLNFSDIGNGKWKIGFENNNAIVENSTSSNEKLLYNSGSPRFKTYTSNQTAIQLYRKPAGEDTREDAQLSFSSATATATVGEPFTAPQLTKNPSDITVTWSSSDQDVAYIYQDSGEIRIKKAGTTTITAKFAGNSQYKPASAIYVLTVNPSYEITLQGVTDGKVFVGAANNAQVTFKVSSSYAWDTNVSFESNLASSFTITPTQSVAGDDVVVTVTSSVANEAEAARQLGSVTISNSGSTQTIQIWQKGKVSDWSLVNSSNITLRTTGGTSASTCTVKINNEDVGGLKAGTNNAAGAVKITVPEGSSHLHVHIAGWNGESVKITVTRANNTLQTLTLKSDTGVSGNSPFTLTEKDPSKFYFDIPLSAVSTDIDLSFTATSGKRFVIWGVNAE